ncbi:MAG: peptidoglycan-N-acetylglucosamine deacetylase [Thermoplasmata archaeon]|nr:peptidoglycan-N-acetylglucosamine deacetylase [Thermoplasmata archaeon]
MLFIPRTPEDWVVWFGILVLASGLTFVHLGVLLARRALLKLRGRRWRDVPSDFFVAGAPPREPTIAFLVAVYNDALTIGPCVESILAQSRPLDQIVVVDDGSTDGTPAVLDTFRSRGVTVLRMPRNGGKTAAIEEGLRHVRTELVAITDADSLVHRDYVKEIIPSFEDPEVAGVGGAVESLPHSWVTAARSVEYMITLRLDRTAEDAMDSLLVLPGVSSTYRRRVLVRMGFEHDTIAEDFDLTFRMQRAGHKLTMNRRAVVYTSDPPTLRSYHRQLTRWYTDLWITVRKHRGMLGRRLFGAVEVPLLVVNLWVYSVLILAAPLYFLLFDPGRLVSFLFWELVMDVAFVALALRVYGRPHVLWGLLSRYPTRLIARWVTLVTFFRVAVGRPGMAWTKLERRATAGLLHAASR